VLEVSMPDVVCQKCGTRFVLAIQSGALFMRSQLVETQQGAPSRDSIVTRQSSQNPETKYCSKCGTQLPRPAAFCSSCGEPQK